MNCLMSGLAFALSASSLLFGQIDPSIPFRAGQGVTLIQSPLNAAEQIMRIRIMQEQERAMAQQREAMAQQAVEENFRKGYEAGLKRGMEDGSAAAFKEFNSFLPTYGETVIRNLANLIFKAEDPDQFRTLISQFELQTEQDPGDQMKKALLILYRARLAELIPPKIDATPKKKKRMERQPYASPITPKPARPVTVPTPTATDPLLPTPMPGSR